ncbi:hypothetical protein DC20_06770 [Rufibacter tibetensis]|uniref:Uncharacterized protein n=2 Tax=Rufibacter tibetensis TaxID=512763 RepID=A0A0P0C1H1_9BACT|nr:hypothetical protein DC20_06770 [Rufibacter tibetensis]
MERACDAGSFVYNHNCVLPLNKNQPPENMRNKVYAFLVLLLSVFTACSQAQEGTRSTTDTDTATSESTPSPSAATSSAGSSGMGGAVSTHALASDTLSEDTSRQE